MANSEIKIEVKIGDHAMVRLIELVSGRVTEFPTIIISPSASFPTFWFIVFTPPFSVTVSKDS
jgi:hypothetical protein